MKSHALSICLASALIASAAMAGGSTRTSARSKVKPKSAPYVRLAQADTTTHAPRAGMSEETTTRTRKFYSAGTFYPEQYMYLREVLYPNMQSEEAVAQKVSQIIEKQNMEIAHLTSVAPAAQTAGWTNVATVYEHMAQDHSRIATWASDWLRERGYTPPAMPAGQPAAFESPDASIDHVMQMHIDSFNNNLAMRQGETSSTVRGLLLWAAAGTARHISLLRTLDRDVDFGRRTVSARLQSMMTGPVSVSEQTAMIDRIMTEETEYFASRDTTVPSTAIVQTPVIEHVVEVERVVEKPVEVERIVEKPVVVEKIVEKPVYVEKIVEKRVYVPTSRVAGRRQTTRRPAK